MLLKKKRTKRNQRGNLKIPQDKSKWKHNFPKPMDVAKVILRGNFKVIQDFCKEQQKTQTNKQPSNVLIKYKNKQSLMPAEGRK